MPERMADVAGRIVLVVDASVPAAAREACDAAAALARRAGMPVTLAAVPIEALDAVHPVAPRPPGQIRELVPPGLSSLTPPRDRA